MELPVPERIGLDIVATLRRIKRSAGYATDLVAVERRQIALAVPSDWKAVLQEDDAELIDENTYPLGRWRLPYVIAIFPAIDETSAVAPDSTLNLIWADVQRALYIDRSRGNLAEKTIVTRAQKFSDAIALHVDVQARFRLDDPTVR